MRKIILLSILIVPVLFISCQSEPTLSTEFSNAPLYGMIYDYDNSPCADVIITADERTRVQSDINGRFQFFDFSRGAHTFKAEKPGYETWVMDNFYFTNRTQILYIKMISLQQIINMIEKALDEKSWAIAESWVERGKVINEKHAILRYLEAVLNIKREKFEDAIAILTGLIADGNKEAYTYLTLADIYQYTLKDIDKAREYLTLYLQLAGDPDVEKRLKDLEG
ncbi:MAG: hypothetical protein JW969_01970 [Spirochaetales bacterium]|nr:hypothetical protein [Spirochaetales bacterium]